MSKSVADDFANIEKRVTSLHSTRLLGPVAEVKGYLPSMNSLHIYSTPVASLTEKDVRDALVKGKKEADDFIEYQDCRTSNPDQRYT